MTRSRTAGDLQNGGTITGNLTFTDPANETTVSVFPAFPFGTGDAGSIQLQEPASSGTNGAANLGGKGRLTMVQTGATDTNVNLDAMVLLRPDGANESAAILFQNDVGQIDNGTALTCREQTGEAYYIIPAKGLGLSRGFTQFPGVTISQVYQSPGNPPVTGGGTNWVNQQVGDGGNTTFQFASHVAGGAVDMWARITDGTGAFQPWQNIQAVASSARFKSDIEDLDGTTLDEVRALRPRKFLMKDGKQPRWGFVVEELQAQGLDPLLSVSEEDGATGYYSEGIVAMLTKSVQDMADKSDKLVSLLETIIDALPPDKAGPARAALAALEVK